MASTEHVARLLRGREEWNRWREAEEDLPDLSSADLHGANLRAVNFLSTDLTGANLRDADLTGANLCDANLTGADLTGANLRDANIFAANLSSAILRVARLFGAHLSSATLTGANLAGAILSSANFSDADLTGADLSSADLHGANLTGANLRKANLRGAYLTGANLIGTDLQGSVLDGCSVYGVSVWDAHLTEASQIGLRITPPEQPDIMVDDLEVAQFIYLLLNNAKLRSVIDTIGNKAVLILGRFTEERKAVLDAVRDALRLRGLLPIIFDFAPPRSRDLFETVHTLAHLSRFIIADLTDPRSIPGELATIVPMLPSVPVQPVIHESQNPWAMFPSLRNYDWVLEPYRYVSTESLIASLDTRVLAPAEAAVQRRRARG